MATQFNAFAAAYVPKSGGDISSTVSTAQGGTTYRTVASRNGDVINIMDYGARCDGVTDDSAAINAAVTALRTRVIESLATDLVLGSGRCHFTTSLNFTGIISDMVVIDGSRSSMDCAVQGAACIDATGTGHLVWRDLHILSTAGSPTIGLLMERATASSPCGEQKLFSPVIIGSFSLAALYDAGCESTSFFEPHFENRGTGTQSYAAVYDGANHWNPASLYLPTSWPQESANSFNENSTFGGTFVASGGAPIWMESASRHRFYGSYALSSNNGPAFVLYAAQSGNPTLDLVVDMHFEVGPSAIFFVTGTDPNPVLRGLSYSDHLCQATGSVIMLDTTETSLSLDDLDIKIPLLLATPTLFAQPALVTASGIVRMPAAGWNLGSQQFSGVLDLGGVETIVSRVIPRIASVALTTSGYIVAPGTDLIRFNQSAIVSGATITLPKGLADGVAIQFINYAGQVNALSFSPVVSGWSQGGGLAANSGIRIRWDATQSGWFREQ